MKSRRSEDQFEEENAIYRREKNKNIGAYSIYIVN